MTGRLPLCGGVILLAFLGILGLSDNFVYGEGHADRPLIAFQLVYTLAWLGFAGAVWALHKGQRLSLLSVLMFAAAMRAVLVPSEVIQEDDFYRYIWDGQMLLHGSSPYVAAPAHISARELVGDSPRLAQAELVHSRINHPQVKTIYPPVAEAAFALNGLLWGWEPHGFRFTWLLIDPFIALLLLLALRAARLSSRWIILYAWNPLVLKEYINGMHVDILAVFFLAIFAAAVLRSRHWLAALGLVGASLVKIVPIALVPLHLAYLWQQGRRRQAIGIGIGVAAVGLASLGLMHVGASAPLEGLRTFADKWETNGSFFPLMRSFANVAFDAETAGRITRGASALIFGGWLLWGMRRLPSRHALFTACLYTLLLAFLLGPVGNPWYLGWMLPFVVLTRNPLALLAMAMTSLYYLNFYLIYHHASGQAYALLQIIEYLPLLLFWALNLRKPA
jgi:hypothetical protein